MGCSSCGVDKGGTPTGCGDKGHCSTGGCNKLNTYDWISTKDLYDPTEYHVVEVSFKKGAHKDFFINDPNTKAVTGDMVVVETSSGYDIGSISLSGELVRLQMKKKLITEDRVTCSIIRRANERDLEKLEEARALEKASMVKARVIARTLGLDMKVGDVEFQGDKKKATFYYTAEGRVDFRELVKEYAKEFKVKIEMRQIGARQESARIGGIGSCGRELCCSTWLSDFKSVNTSAARYQNTSINQSKLSGQCGRLKCCLNYELDTYMDALKDFPEHADVLKTKLGSASLVKTDIFKGLMYYMYDGDRMRGTFVTVDKERVKVIKSMNNKGIFPDELLDKETLAQIKEEQDNTPDYEDVTGQIELPVEQRRKNKRPNKKGGNNPNNQNRGNSQNNTPNNRNENQRREIVQKPTSKPNNEVKPILNRNSPRPEQSADQPITQKGPNPNQKGPNPNQKGPNPNQKGPNPNQSNNPNQQSNQNKGQNPNQKASTQNQNPNPNPNQTAPKNVANNTDGSNANEKPAVNKNKRKFFKKKNPNGPNNPNSGGNTGG